MSFSYFDHPDGEDTVRKIAFTSRYALLAGLLKSTCDVILIEQTTGYINIARRVLAVTSPLVGATAIGTGVISMSTNLRHKDDSVNYLIGGAIGGLCYGLFRGKLSTALNCAGLSAFIAQAFKYNHKRGVIFDESEKLRANDVDVWRKYEDFSLTRVPPKGWVAASN